MLDDCNLFFSYSNYVAELFQISVRVENASVTSIKKCKYLEEVFPKIFTLSKLILWKETIKMYRKIYMFLYI